MSSDRATRDFACRARDAEGLFSRDNVVGRRPHARAATPRRRGRCARSPRDAFLSCRPAPVARWIGARALTVKVERAARREVSSAEAKVTTDARLGAAGATARARRDSVLPTKAGRATTAEAAEVMAAIVSTRCVRIWPVTGRDRPATFAAQSESQPKKYFLESPDWWRPIER